MSIWISGIYYPHDGWSLTGIWTTPEAATTCATTPVGGHEWTPSERANEWQPIATHDAPSGSGSYRAFIREYPLDAPDKEFQSQVDAHPEHLKWALEEYGPKKPHAPEDP